MNVLTALGAEGALSTPMKAARRSAGRWCRSSVFAVIVVLCAPLAAFGEEPNDFEKELDKLRQSMSDVPNVENGRDLSKKLCAGCHLIGGQAATGASAAADVPSFARIANRPEQTSGRLTNWLMAPHAPMPDPHLSRLEIRDLTGYILSLRTAQP